MESNIFCMQGSKFIGAWRPNEPDARLHIKRSLASDLFGHQALLQTKPPVGLIWTPGSKLLKPGVLFNLDATLENVFKMEPGVQNHFERRGPFDSGLRSGIRNSLRHRTTDGAQKRFYGRVIKTYSIF